MTALQGARPPNALPVKGLDSHDELIDECKDPIETSLRPPLKMGIVSAWFGSNHT